VDFGVERFVSRRGVDYSVRRAILDAGLAGGVSEFASAGAVALAVWAESDGGSHRWFPMGADGCREASGAQMAISAIVVAVL